MSTIARVGRSGKSCAHQPPSDHGWHRTPLDARGVIYKMWCRFHPKTLRTDKIQNLLLPENIYTCSLDFTDQGNVKCFLNEHMVAHLVECAPHMQGLSPCCSGLGSIPTCVPFLLHVVLALSGICSAFMCAYVQFSTCKDEHCVHVLFLCVWEGFYVTSGQSCQIVCGPWCWVCVTLCSCLSTLELNLCDDEHSDIK